MKYKYLSLVILTYAMIYMISCQNRKNYLMTDVIEIDNSEQNLDTLVGRNIGFDYMGVNNVYCHDSLLVVCTSDPNGFYKIINTINKTEICKLCYKGRAVNEMLSPFNDYLQLFETNEMLYLYVPDNETSIKSINLTKSIEKGVAVHDSVFPTESFDIVQSIRLNNDRWFDYKLAISEDPMVGKYSTPHFFIRNSNKNKELKLFGRILNPIESYLIPPLYRGVVRAKPDGNAVVYAMTLFPYIHIFDMNKKSITTLHEKDGAVFDGPADVESFVKLPISVVDVETTDSYIYTLSVGYSEMDLAVLETTPLYKLNVFNWEGEKIYSAFFDIPVTRITYSQYTNSIFGKYKEEIYEFDLPHIE